MIPGIIAAGAALAVGATGDPYYGNVSSLLYLEGANGSSVFTDEKGITWSAEGGATISTDILAAGSLKLNGTTQAITAASNASWNLGSGNFTIEASFRLTGYSVGYSGNYVAAFVSKYGNSVGAEFYCVLKGTVSSWTQIAFLGASDNVGGLTEVAINYSFALNTDYVVRVVRSGNTVYWFVNGTLIGSGSFSRTIQTTTEPLRIGRSGFSGFELRFPGYIWAVRVTKAVARSTTSYTPETRFPNFGTPAIVVENFGDSLSTQTTASGASTPVNTYISKLMAQKDWLNHNNAVSGHMAYDQADAVYARSVALKDRSTLMLGTNDQRIYGVSQPTRRACFKRAHMALLAWLGIAASNKIRGQSGSVSYTGTWANTGVYGGTLGKNSTVPGSKATFTISGRAVYIWYIQQNGNAGAAEVRIDGVLVDTLSATGPGVATGAGRTYGPALARFTGLSDSSHTVEITTTTVSGLSPFYFDAAAAPAADARVNVLTVARFTASGYAVNGGSDTNVAEYNADILDNVRALQSDGLNLAMSDAWAVINPATHIVADGVHWNDAGHAIVTERAAADF